MSAAHAEIGDLIGDIYTTDILTQVDGLDIKRYAIDRKTLMIYGNLLLIQPNDIYAEEAA